MIRRAPKAERTLDGTVFDSKSEMLRYQELCLLERAGKITNLRRQVKYPLVIDGRPVVIRSVGYPDGRRCFYRADFVYVEIEDNDSWPLRETLEDWKGIATESSRLRIAVIEAIYNVRVKVTGPNKYRTTKRLYRRANISLIDGAAQ